MYEKPDLKRYIDLTFGSVEKVRMEILCDFFRQAEPCASLRAQ